MTDYDVDVEEEEEDEVNEGDIEEEVRSKTGKHTLREPVE